MAVVCLLGEREAYGGGAFQVKLDEKLGPFLRLILLTKLVFALTTRDLVTLSSRDQPVVSIQLSPRLLCTLVSK